MNLNFRMNPAVKKKIFDLYTGQTKSKIDYYMMNNEEQLILKPLMLLSNNEVYEYTELLWPDRVTDDETFESLRDTIIKLFQNENTDVQGFTLFTFIHVLDQLRSNGYALPAFGYTVEQLIKEKVFRMIDVDSYKPPIYILGKSGDSSGNQIVETGSKRKGNQSKSLETLLNKK